MDISACGHVYPTKSDITTPVRPPYHIKYPHTYLTPNIFLGNYPTYLPHKIFIYFATKWKYRRWGSKKGPAGRVLYTREGSIPGCFNSHATLNDAVYPCESVMKISSSISHKARPATLPGCARFLWFLVILHSCNMGSFWGDSWASVQDFRALSCALLDQLFSFGIFTENVSSNTCLRLAGMPAMKSLVTSEANLDP